jgi:nitrate reductase (cytochrome), electron transfer subunit
MSEDGRFRRERVLGIVGLVALLTAGIASLAEFRKPPPRRDGYAAPGNTVQVGRKALSYSELRQSTRGPDRNVYLASAEQLRAQIGPLTGEFQRSPEEREAMLRARAERRAYDGAPPVVPHPVDERAIPNCLTCHEKGAVVGGLTARALSHPAFGSCLQCHTTAPAAHGSPTVASVAPESAFEPEPFGGHGTRAWPEAPPAMPHSNWMRQNCSSCHGVAGHPGLRTPHADRQNCQQCHATTAGQDAVLSTFARGEPK